MSMALQYTLHVLLAYVGTIGMCVRLACRHGMVEQGIAEFPYLWLAMPDRDAWVPTAMRLLSLLCSRYIKSKKALSYFLN